MPKYVYVAVVSHHEYHLDDQGRSYLPTFRPVLGVYKDFYEAHGKVFRTFSGAHSNEYEELRVDGDTYEYKYEDKEYGGFVIYTVKVCKQRIGEED